MFKRRKREDLLFSVLLISFEHPLIIFLLKGFFYLESQLNFIEFIFPFFSCSASFGYSF